MVTLISKNEFGDVQTLIDGPCDHLRIRIMPKAFSIGIFPTILFSGGDMSIFGFQPFFRGDIIIFFGRIHIAKSRLTCVAHNTLNFGLVGFREPLYIYIYLYMYTLYISPPDLGAGGYVCQHFAQGGRLPAFC